MQEIKEIKRELHEQGGLIKDIHLAIKGNPDYGIPGMVDTLQDHGKRLESLEQFRHDQNVKDAKHGWSLFRERMKGAIGGFTIGAGAMTPKAVWLKFWAWLTQIGT